MKLQSDFEQQCEKGERLADAYFTSNAMKQQASLSFSLQFQVLASLGC